MNFRLIFNTMGYILWVEAGFLMLPPVVALVYGENCWLAFCCRPRCAASWERCCTW